MKPHEKVYRRAWRRGGYQRRKGRCWKRDLRRRLLLSERQHNWSYASEVMRLRFGRHQSPRRDELSRPARRGPWGLILAFKQKE